MNDTKVKFPLSRKMAVMVIAIAVILSTVLIAVSTAHYKREMIDDFERMGMDVAAIAASQLDPDRFQKYLDTGVKDKEYLQDFNLLCDIRESADVEYVYVVVPKEDEVWYLMDTDPSERQIPLGYHEPYYEGAFAANAERMAAGEQIAPIVSNEEFGWLMSVYHPLKTSAGDPAGYVGVDILMTNVRENLNSFVLNMICLLALLTAILSVILIRITSKTVTEPICSLSSAARQFVEDDQSGEMRERDIFRPIQINSNDEIGDLSHSLAIMERDMNAYLRDLLTISAEKQRLVTELSLATRIQEDMLPNVFPAFPERRDFDIYASMTAALEVGGDFYDYFLVDDSHLCMVMADVSGKGIPAALFMMATKIILASNARMGLSPAEVLTKANNVICANNREEMFVTVWLGVLDLTTGLLTAANAGHEYPVLRQPDGQFQLYKDKHSFVIGGLDGITYKEYQLQLEPGSKLFLYTDGLPEATNADMQLFGVERMLAVLNDHLEAPPEQLLSSMHSAVDQFVQQADQFDDLTMLCMEYCGPAEHPVLFSDTLELEAAVEHLPRVLDFVEQALEQADCPMKAQNQIAVAVEEIFVNIAHYAYAPGKGDAKISLKITDEPRTAEITFRDHGVHFDPLAKEDPDIGLDAQQRQIGGLGIFMVKKTMDELHYAWKDEQNCFTLIKRF